MTIELVVVSKECRVNRYLKKVEIVALPEIGETLSFPVGEDGADVLFTVTHAHDEHAELKYQVDRLSLDHLIADGWREAQFYWPV